MKHNKKRNTAFLYEVLLREGTKAIIDRNITRMELIKKIIFEHFSSKTELYKELALFKSLKENSVEEPYAEKFVREVEARYDKLDKTKIFNEQTSLIKVLNKMLGAGTFNSFIPNYKDLATMTQMFNPLTPIKEKILLEQKIIDKIKIVKEEKQETVMQPSDNLLYKTYIKNFNQKYTSLLKEQKELLTKFAGTFSNDDIELKVYLNEEIGRLISEVNNSLEKEDIKNDQETFEKTKKTIGFLESIKESKEITPELLQKIMKLQQFVHEVNS